MLRINGRASFTELLNVQSSKVINSTHNTTELSSAECSAPRGGISRHGEQKGDRRLKAVVPASHTLCEGCVSTRLKPVQEPLDIDPISPGPSSPHTNRQSPAPSTFICKTDLSTLRLELAWPPAPWGCRGLCGRMWTQRPVSHRKGWPETYWILGAEPGALGQSRRLRVRRAGLELMFV